MSYNKMSSYRLLDAIRVDPVAANRMKGILSADQLRHLRATPGSFYIVNTAPSYRAGVHWVCFHIPVDRREPVEFWDSLGQTPEHYTPDFVSFLRRLGRPYLYYNERLQEKGSTLCGAYCLYYIVNRCRDQSLVSIATGIRGDAGVLSFVTNYFGSSV